MLTFNGEDSQNFSGIQFVPMVYCPSYLSSRLPQTCLILVPYGLLLYWILVDIINQSISCSNNSDNNGSTCTAQMLRCAIYHRPRNKCLLVQQDNA